MEGGQRWPAELVEETEGAEGWLEEERKIEDVMARSGIGKKSHRRLSLMRCGASLPEQWLLQASVSTGQAALPPPCSHSTHQVAP